MLATLILGMLLPVIVLTARPAGRSGLAALFCQAVRLPQPGWLVVPALVTVSVLGWLTAYADGGAQPLSGGLLNAAGIQLVTGMNASRVVGAHFSQPSAAAPQPLRDAARNSAGSVTSRAA